MILSLFFSFNFCLVFPQGIVSLKYVLFHFELFRFVSFRSISFRFISFRFVSVNFVSFRRISFQFISFRFVSFRFRFAFYRYPIFCSQFSQFFLSLKYKYTIMCNYLNKYTNLNDAYYIRYTSLWNLYKKCIPYLSGIFSKLCSNKKKDKKSLWFQSIPLSKYPYTLG